MTTIAGIEALGIEVPKTKDADEELGGWWGDGIKGERARKQAKRIHDDSASELLAVIERLAEANRNLHATPLSVKMPPNAAEAAVQRLRVELAEADLAAMTEERDRLKHTLALSYPHQHLWDEEDRCTALRADLAAMTKERDSLAAAREEAQRWKERAIAAGGGTLKSIWENDDLRTRAEEGRE